MEFTSEHSGCRPLDAVFGFRVTIFVLQQHLTERPARRSLFLRQSAKHVRVMKGTEERERNRGARTTCLFTSSKGVLTVFVVTTWPLAAYLLKPAPGNQLGTYFTKHVRITIRDRDHSESGDLHRGNESASHAPSIAVSSKKRVASAAMAYKPSSSSTPLYP